MSLTNIGLVPSDAIEGDRRYGGRWLASVRWLATFWLHSHVWFRTLSCHSPHAGTCVEVAPTQRRCSSGSKLCLTSFNVTCPATQTHHDNNELILMHCVHSKRDGSRLGGCYQSKQLLAATFLVSMLAPGECARACFCVLWRSLSSPLTPPRLHRFPTLSPQATPAELAVLVAQVIILFDNLCQQVSTAIADQTWAPLR